LFLFVALVTIIYAIVGLKTIPVKQRLVAWVDWWWIKMSFDSDDETQEEPSPQTHDKNTPQPQPGHDFDEPTTIVEL
jgi:hypothetical protein